MLQKIKIYIIAALLLCTMVPMQSIAGTQTKVTAISSAQPGTPAYVKVMLLRLDEINDMDKSNLTNSDKKALRKEVRTIKKSLRVSSNGGIYLSGGAVIIIIILLIILL